MLEIFIAIIGITQGVLAMLNKRINWLVYAFQMILLVIFSYHAKLYGDMIHNSIYFFICLISFWMWNKDGIAKKITRLNVTQISITIIALVIAIFIIGRILTNYDDPLPYIDATTTVTMFVALMLMSFHKLEAWIIWFINDIAFMIQYLMLPDQAIYLFILNMIWSVLAVLSFFSWRKLYKLELNVRTKDIELSGRNGK